MKSKKSRAIFVISILWLLTLAAYVLNDYWTMTTDYELLGSCWVNKNYRNCSSFFWDFSLAPNYEYYYSSQEFKVKWESIKSFNFFKVLAFGLIVIWIISWIISETIKWIKKGTN